MHTDLLSSCWLSRSSWKNTVIAIPSWPVRAWPTLSGPLVLYLFSNSNRYASIYSPYLNGIISALFYTIYNLLLCVFVRSEILLSNFDIVLCRLSLLTMGGGYLFPNELEEEKMLSSLEVLGTGITEEAEKSPVSPTNKEEMFSADWNFYF